MSFAGAAEGRLVFLRVRDIRPEERLPTSSSMSAGRWWTLCTSASRVCMSVQPPVGKVT